MIEIFDDVIKQWRLTDSQRMIFGIDTLQTQNAIKDLTQCLEKVFKKIPTFSLVLKGQAMEIIVKNDEAHGDDPPMTSLPILLPSLPKVFKDLKVDSVTLNIGVTNEELKHFFSGVSMKLEDLDQHGGLKGYLKEQGVVHIVVGQMKFQLLRDDEQITSTGVVTDGKLKGGGAKTKEEADLKKAHDALWGEYLSGSLDQNDFRHQHEDIVSGTSQDPKKLGLLLKRLMKKEKDTEKFLFQLDQKLSDAGLSQEVIASLKKKLHTPKKVLIPEDELARLRKIAKDYQEGPGQGTGDVPKTVKVIQKKLKDEQARSEAMLRQLSEGGVVLDKKGIILSINATAQKALGCSQKQACGKNIKDILKAHHVLTMVSDWQDETENHTPKNVKAKAIKDETMAIIRESTIVLENEEGRSVGVLAALQNVTQQEELNRRKNDILDVLGHDLRAPLGAIRQNFDVLVLSMGLNEKCNDKQKKFLDNCFNNITRMSRLIEKILDMRQLETGKIMLKYDTVETGALLEQAVTSLNEWAKNKSIKLEVKAGKIPNIDGDPERLYQVITNFVSNALKFTPEKGTITAEGKLVKNKGVEYVQISVKDTGMGIDEENLKRIFDKYEQVTVNTPAGVSGLGLGLSICQTVIELHGGSIWAESELEKGSTFIFQIPVKHVEE